MDPSEAASTADTHTLVASGLSATKQGNAIQNLHPLRWGLLGGQQTVRGVRGV